MTIRRGDIVTIKPQWRDPGDDLLTWVARNDEEKGRLDISAVEQCNMPLWPMQTVRADMVEATGQHIEEADARRALR